MKKTAVYPGTFDPVTFGHLDIIQRASLLFDELIIAVPDQQSKKPVFSLETREFWLKESVKPFEGIMGHGKIYIEAFDGLLVNYLQSRKIQYVIRGLRSTQDFEYEIQLAGINKALLPHCESIFLMTEVKYAHISSSLVREVGRLGGDISAFVPKIVCESLPWH